MNDNTIEKLAKTLSAETTEIIPYLPYLLQDFWELGSSPSQMLEIFKKHIPMTKGTKVLDLGCGKGAISIQLSKALGIHFKGIDILPEFIQYAKEKAIEYSVSHLCEFAVEDITKSVSVEKNFDCVIFGAIGDIFGDYDRTIKELCLPIKDKGFMLLDDGYVKERKSNSNLDFNRTYPTIEEWNDIFKKHGLVVIEFIPCLEQEYDDVDKEMEWITLRAKELIQKYPAKKDLFEQYLSSQRAEYNDLQNDLIGATWLLQKQ